MLLNNSQSNDLANHENYYILQWQNHIKYLIALFAIAYNANTDNLSMNPTSSIHGSIAIYIPLEIC